MRAEFNIFLDRDCSSLIDFLNESKMPYDYQSGFYPARISKKQSGSRVIQLSALICGIIGFAAALLYQYYTSAIYYPLNTGNRGTFSIVSALPIAFEIAVLLAGLAAFTAFILLNSKLTSNKGSLKSDSDFILFCETKDVQQIEDFLIDNNFKFERIEREI